MRSRLRSRGPSTNVSDPSPLSGKSSLNCCRLTSLLSLSLSLSSSDDDDDDDILFQNAVNQDVPSEFQRILNTMADLDHRVSKTRDDIQEKVNECLELPGLHSRGLSKDNETKILKLRKDIDESHAHAEMLSKEKMRLAALALEILEKNVMVQMDEDLERYREELKANQEFGEEEKYMSSNKAMDMDIGTPTRGPSRQGSRMGGAGGNNSSENLPGLGNEQPSGGQKKNSQVGDLVAANIGELNIGPGAHEWIVGTVLRYIPATDEYDIVDADDDTNKNNPNKNNAGGNKKGTKNMKKTGGKESKETTYRLSAKTCVIPLPKTANPSHGATTFDDGTYVLAVYPQTTTFYKAKVVRSAARTAPSGEYGEFLLEFEDDGDVPRRAVPFRHVVECPKTM